MRTKKLVLFSLFCAISLVLGYFEHSIPLFNVIPGGKIGLANCVTLVMFACVSPIEAFAFGILRAFLTSVLISGVQTFIYSAVGTVLSVLAMTFAKKLLKKKVTEIGISVLGALFFNVGQIFVCSLVVLNVQVFRYLPVLGIISVISGFITGYIAKKLIIYLNLKNNRMEK